MKTEGYFIVQKGEPSKAFELRDFEIADPGDNEVLIEVEAFGLNYADVMARKGLYRDAPPFPSIVGYEVVGKVISTGENTNKELLGKRVLAFTRFGGYARHAVTTEMACTVVSDESAGELLALCTQGVTAYYMAMYLSPVRKGDKALVHAAAGGVGSLLIQLVKLNGGEAIAKVGSDEKVSHAIGLGAAHAVNYKKSNYDQYIKEHVGKIDISYNPVGGSTFKKDMALMNAGGRMFIFGGSELGDGKWGVLSALNFVRKMGLIIPVGLMIHSKNILGVNMLRIADNKPQVLKDSLDGIMDLYRAGKITVPASQEFEHTALNEAHSLLDSGRSIGKIWIKW